jgi:GH25 family lysozyme M1 (1,4-beta-N-acetylmuramidase)
MALGIDIYRYQTVTDWKAVKRHGVSYVYVKGTDGGGPAIARADSQVRGAQSVTIPVGLYHYAQLTPSPEKQADILTAEVHRLDATGMPPALDLEDPHRPGPAARDFTNRFLSRLRQNGFDTVCLYANTSMLTGICGPQIDDDPNIVIWAANYGRNDGRRHPLSYSGRVDIHQYTSVGIVPGISGRVDLNESLTDISRTGADMPLSEEDVQRVATAVWEQRRPHLDPNDGTVLPMWIWAVGANMGAWEAVDNDMPTVEDISKGLVTQLTPIVRDVMAEQAAKTDRVSDLDDAEIAEAVARRMFAGPSAATAGEGE